VSNLDVSAVALVDFFARAFFAAGFRDAPFFFFATTTPWY
jgi:hypothetical protein